MKLQDYLARELGVLKERSLYRELRQELKTPICFSSNSYLGSSYGRGASRLMTPHQGSYAALEKLLASWKKTESALVFPTGYMANVGTITALMGKGDVIVIDKLCHASIIDGCHLSGATLRIFKHNDVADLRRVMRSVTANKILIITESVFSMDGDLAPLADIVACAKEFHAWTYVDEAHAVGVLGETGAGLIEKLGLQGQVDIQMGTLSKAIDSVGGYVVGSNLLCEFLINRARSFIFTTGLPDAVVQQSIKNVKRIMQDDRGRQRLWHNIVYFYAQARKAGLKIEHPHSAIIPIMIGDESRAISVSQELVSLGILLPAVRFPTVPKGKARLRCTVTANHTQKEIDRLVASLARVVGE